MDFLIADYLRSDAVKAKEVDANYKRLLPLLAQYLYTAKREDLDEISEKIKEFYFQNRSIGVETDEKLAEVSSMLSGSKVVDSYFYGK